MRWLGTANRFRPLLLAALDEGQWSGQKRWFLTLNHRLNEAILYGKSPLQHSVGESAATVSSTPGQAPVLRTTLVQAAHATVRSKGTLRSAQYRRLVARRVDGGEARRPVTHATLPLPAQQGTLRGLQRSGCRLASSEGLPGERVAQAAGNALLGAASSAPGPM